MRELILPTIIFSETEALRSLLFSIMFYLICCWFSFTLSVYHFTNFFPYFSLILISHKQSYCGTTDSSEWPSNNKTSYARNQQTLKP